MTALRRGPRHSEASGRPIAIAALVSALLCGLLALAHGAGTPDAGLRDAGPGPADAGGVLDAGVPIFDDALLVDAGVVDAPVDAPVDAAIMDAPIDAAPSVLIGEPPPVPIESPTAATTTATTVFAIKVIGGLIVLLALAYLGAQRRVVRFQERLGISGVITAGFPFVALGLIARSDVFGILSGPVLENIRPVMYFGLGWLGFIIGAQLDIRVLERVPKGTAYLIFVEALAPFVAVAGACVAVMLAFGSSWREPAVWRDGILLGAAAAMTAPRRFRGFANRSWRENRSADILLGQLDELIGVVSLLFITAYFRAPGASAWQMPNQAWIFVSLGIGVAVGALIFAMVRMPSSSVEFLAVLVGGIAFASGFAGFLHLSPIVICFLAGVLVTNFPNDERENVFRILRHLERPLHLMFLIVAGAMWDVSDWRGWVLVPVFVCSRVAGKWLGTTMSKRVLAPSMPPRFLDDRQLVVPLSALSIGLVISVSHTYAGQSIAWVVTAVIGGAIVTELLIPARKSDEPEDDDPAAAPAAAQPASPPPADAPEAHT